MLIRIQAQTSDLKSICFLSVLLTLGSAPEGQGDTASFSQTWKVGELPSEPGEASDLLSPVPSFLEEEVVCPKQKW